MMFEFLINEENKMKYEINSKIKKILLTTLALSTGAFAHNEGHIEVKNCMIQETIPGAKVTGAFMVMDFEKGNIDVALTKAKIPTISKHIEIHEMKMNNGSMIMSKMDKFPLKTGDNIFKKGGYHIMLMDIKKPVIAGETHKITFFFDNSETAECDAVVKTVEEVIKYQKETYNDKPMKHMDMKHK